MTPFRYLRDPLFLLGCAVYVLNRWSIKPHPHHGFFHPYFDDFWLIACALPPVLWLHHRLGQRNQDRPPQITTVATPHASWLGTDFQVASGGRLRLRSRLIQCSMYAFFRAVTRLPADKLTPLDALSKCAGFSLHSRVESEQGLLHSDRWIRTAVK